MKSEAIVFLGQVYPQGLVRHLAYLGIELSRLSQCGTPFYFASVDSELDPGAWDLVASKIKRESIIRAGNFETLLDKVVGLLGMYERIVFHCGGGWRQMERIIPLKKKYKTRFRLVITTHSFANGTWRRLPMSTLQFLLYSKYVDKVVFQCPYAGRMFALSSFLFLRARACVIPLGCEAMKSTGNECPLAVKDLGIEDVLEDDGLFKFVYLAGFGKVKNHDWLLRAVAPVLKENKNARLLLLGSAKPERREEVLRLIKVLGLDCSVLAPGKVPRIDIPWVLQHCNCALIPSMSETFGHTFVEPMMAGIPVLGTRVGVGEYSIQEYQTGLSFSLGRYDSIREGMKFMLDSPERAKAMGSKAQELAKSLFTHEQVAKAHLAMYSEVLHSI